MTETIYTPLAGGQPVSHPDASQYHRCWLIADDHGNWMDDSQLLSRIDVSLRFGYLVLQAPGMLRLDIPLDVIEDDDSVRRKVKVAGQEASVIDEGDVAALWVTNCLETPCRLFKVDPDAGPVSWPEQAV